MPPNGGRNKPTTGKNGHDAYRSGQADAQGLPARALEPWHQALRFCARCRTADSYDRSTHSRDHLAFYARGWDERFDAEVSRNSSSQGRKGQHACECARADHSVPKYRLIVHGKSYLPASNDLPSAPLHQGAVIDKKAFVRRRIRYRQRERPRSLQRSRLTR